jgi:peptidoglycan hydrolase-like protein with peptidoglycan-binding domain
MRNLRPALLALLLVSAGPGVPGSFAQSNSSPSAAKGTAKKKTETGSASTKSAGSKSSAGKTSSSKALSGKAAAPHKGSSGSMKTSSRRSRRQPGQKAPSSDRVSEIQTALAKDGSFAGAPNGKWDDGTAEAMRRFQAAHGLNPTGKLDALSLQKLGLGSQTAGVAAPTPPPGAVSRLTSSNSLTPSPESARHP